MNATVLIVNETRHHLQEWHVHEYYSRKVLAYIYDGMREGHTVDWYEWRCDLIFLECGGMCCRCYVDQPHESAVSHTACCDPECANRITDDGPAYRVVWRINQKTGHGSPLTFRVAKSVVARLNSTYGNGAHWIERVDQ